MKRRCTLHPKDKGNEYYAGRGIKVCDRWLQSFKAFFEDMGSKPSPNHSLDRFPNQNGDYEPGNCRWATWDEQANNRRNNLPPRQPQTLTLGTAPCDFIGINLKFGD